MHTPEVAASEPPLSAIVVDDDPSIRRLCRTLLEREGWTVLEAADGIEAIILAGRRPPDLIIMDVVMPNLDGLEATRRLRADPAIDGVPIIILSAKDDSSDVVAGLEAGADEYLTKPLDHREFQVRVRSMSRLRRAWREQGRGYGLLGEHARSLDILLDFTGITGRTEELDPLLDKTIEVAATLTSCRRISIMLPEANTGILRIARSMGLDERVAAETAVPVGSSIVGEVFASRQTIVCNSKAEAEALSNRHEENLFDDIFDRPLPMVSMAMCSAEETIGVLSVTDRVGHRPFSTQELEYLNLISNYAAVAIQGVLNRQARDEARDSIVVALAKLAEHRDNDTGKHLERVTAFSLMLAKELQERPEHGATIDSEFLRNLRRAAPLHDIGKVAIPDRILLKPGRLTPEEMHVMKTHAATGAETLQTLLARAPDSGFLRMAEEIAYGHHEWYDGNGYPKGVAGAEIPLPARILALADVYDALTSKRVYKEAMPHEKATEIILGLEETQFDPDIVGAFRRRLDDFARLARHLADEVEAEESSEDRADTPTHRVPVLVRQA